MKKYITIIICCLVVFSTKGQQLGEETWEKISHEVEQLVITNEHLQSELESLLFCTKQDTLSNLFKGYKYFHLYVSEDANCKTLEFRLSNYPYKSENLIGYFVLKGYPVLVHNNLPDFLISRGNKKTFSYTEHRIGDLIMMEDDTPCWIIEYCQSHFKVLHYPTKRQANSQNSLQMGYGMYYYPCNIEFHGFVDDNYTVDEKGNIKLVETTDDSFDKLYTKECWENGKSIISTSHAKNAEAGQRCKKQIFQCVIKNIL